MKHRAKRVFAAILLAVCAGCGFGREDGAIFCADDCPDPKQKRNFFCDCYTPTEPPPGQGGSAPGLVHLERKGECIPSTISPQVWLVNSSNSQQKVTWRHEYWEYDEKKWEKLHTKTLDPWDREYLGCDGTLHYDDRYFIVSAARVTDGGLSLPNDGHGVAGLQGADLQGRVVTVALLAQVSPNAPCRSLCPDFATTARCTTAAIGGENQQGMSVLYTAVMDLSSRNGLLEAEDIRSWFRLRDDPCKRGPTAFLKGKFINIGGPCVLSIPLGSLKAEISVPMTLAGDLVMGSDHLDAQFHKNLESRPEIHFRRSDGTTAPLDGDFGGEIVSVEAQPSSLFVKVSTNRCIGVRY